jgi:hypothetical protein
MSELLNRAREIQELLEDPSLPMENRLHDGLEVLTGLDVTALSRDVRIHLESSFAKLGRTLERYFGGLGDGYQSMDEKDLLKMLAVLSEVTSRIVSVELDRIVARLDAAKNKIPVDAILAARKHRDLMIPVLINVLREVVAAGRRGTVRSGSAPFFALMLLSEFNAAVALPVIIEAVSLPDQLLRRVFGASLTDFLSRILSQFAADRLDVLATLIDDRSVYEFVRWEAAQAYINLIRDGKLTRDGVMERLRRHLRRAIETNDPIASGLITFLDDLSPSEAMDDIREAYERGVADPGIIDLEDVKLSLANPEARMQSTIARCPETGIPDAIEEMRQWSSFKDATEVRTSPPPPHCPPNQPATPPAESTPVARLLRGPHVGRNDPCTCGSGKKFKKCCGAKGRSDEST